MRYPALLFVWLSLFDKRLLAEKPEIVDNEIASDIAVLAAGCIDGQRYCAISDCKIYFQSRLNPGG